jgi:transposase
VALLAWLPALGALVLVGIEGTGVYGSGLARYLQAEGVPLVEVDRPDRKARRWQGKSDPVDAEAAARAALAQVRTGTGTPKQRQGRVEALRALRVARRSTVAHRADLQRQLKALVVTARGPAPSAARPAAGQLIDVCAAARPDRKGVDDRRSPRRWRCGRWHAGISS